MRVFSKHSNLTAIRAGGRPANAGGNATPVLPVVLEFALRNGNSMPISLLGMVDTGASMTIIPGYYLGLAERVGLAGDSLNLAENADDSTLAGKMDFEAVSVSGIFGNGRVPGYKAFVKIGGLKLKKEIMVGAIVGQWEPLIGRDIINEFILSMDPWQRTTALANGVSGRLLSLANSLTKGGMLKQP